MKTERLGAHLRRSFFGLAAMLTWFTALSLLPVAKATALARAWRMVRRLSPVDRMALAEEAGFDGAEDLLENLAAKKGGVAPALMLQFLNNLRDRGDEGLSDVMEGLRNPETRDDILMRGADAVAEAASGVEKIPRIGAVFALAGC